MRVPGVVAGGWGFVDRRSLASPPAQPFPGQSQLLHSQIIPLTHPTWRVRHDPNPKVRPDCEPISAERRTFCKHYVCFFFGVHFCYGFGLLTRIRLRPIRRGGGLSKQCGLGLLGLPRPGVTSGRVAGWPCCSDEGVLITYGGENKVAAASEFLRGPAQSIKQLLGNWLGQR